MIINDDAYISKDFFKIFIKNVIKSKPDVVIPLVYRISGGIDSFGAEYFSSGFARNTSDLKTFTTIAPANCVLYKTNLFQKLKKRFGFIFNPVLGFYFEDVEISIRAHSIGAKFTKSEKLIAFHIGSLSAVKHSYFRTFYSYRNVVWLIIINWPLNSVIKYFKNIFLVQSYAFLKSTIYFGPILYMKILWSTIRNIKTLIYYRKTTQKGYLKDFNFEGLLNRHMYKRKNGRYI
ncbi:hypothetical protein A2159_02415 [Candidatus Woesebacteria bacterium RBG_13_34_9]|uniref:Glycosyltransferase 2-like domain-containing protein n=1 Tax=Candidatus Woesebacteria bacterium RBG_13_34_9 TaxID=1802477 RepID=A0A1F7X340_9BACT|nr:MAG: hypothetical protein A2159_02415 [Candidatus Woesebacteria bacterium RBG_13_34_9]